MKSDLEIKFEKLTVLNDIRCIMVLINDDVYNYTQYKENSGIFPRSVILELFGTFKNAVNIIKNDDSITGVNTHILMARDIRRVARELGGRKPTRSEYIVDGKFTRHEIQKMYGSWSQATKIALRK